MRNYSLYMIGAALLVGTLYLFFTGLPEANTEANNDQRIAEPKYSATYNCDDNKSLYAGFGEGIVALALSDGREITLEHVESASGARYANETGVVFHTKDYGAFVEENGEITFRDCVHVPDHPEADFVGTTWEWVEVLYNDETRVEPKKPRDFTITFSDGGRFSAETDCNAMGGAYSVDNQGLMFSQIISTQMYCEGSIESDFAEMLTNTGGHHFGPDGELILDIKFDSGSAVFKFVGNAQ